jgi:hypothetical protein
MLLIPTAPYVFIFTNIAAGRAMSHNESAYSKSHIYKLLEGNPI